MFSVRIMYSLYSAYSTYSVYSVNSVYLAYNMNSVYSVYSVYSDYNAYSVLFPRPLSQQLRLGPKEPQGTIIYAVHGIPEIEGSIDL